MKVTTRAYANIALIKYWGKKNKELIIPYQSSLSFTVDKFYVETTLNYDKKLKEDLIYLNDELLTESKRNRVVSFLNIVRKRYKIDEYAHVKSYNFMPTAAGLSSSSAAFAALALAATKAYNLNLTKKELSKLARLGSGSATRSIYGGFALWKKGHNDKTSYATKLKIKWKDFVMIACLVSESEKKVSSRAAMSESVKMKEYRLFVKESKKDLKNMKKALKEKDINKVGSIAEKNSLSMHELIKKSGINFLQTESYQLINIARELRNEGIPVYATMDAGPNVKLITLDKHINLVLEWIGNIKTVVLKQGEDAHVRNISTR